MPEVLWNRLYVCNSKILKAAVWPTAFSYYLIVCLIENSTVLDFAMTFKMAKEAAALKQLWKTGKSITYLNPQSRKPEKKSRP